jgi:hypothetical protein
VQALRGTAEVQLLGHRDEVAQMPQPHGDRFVWRINPVETIY